MTPSVRIGRINDAYRTHERLNSVLPVVRNNSSDTVSRKDSILLIRLGGIGDAIRLLPTAAFLLNRGHKGPLHCAVEPPVETVLACTDYFDRIHAIPLHDWPSHLPNIFQRIDDIRNTWFDWIFDCHGILKSGVLARLCRTRRRVGYHPSNVKEFNYIWQDMTINRLPRDLPRLLKYLQLVRSFMKPDSLKKTDLTPVFQAVSPVSTSIRNLSAKNPILIHPTSSKSRYGSRKDWGKDNFKSLVSRIIDDTNRPVRITWGPGERTTANQIAGPFSNQVQPSPSTSPMTNLIHLIKNASLLVTIDSSPLHIADLVGTPSVVIFGVGKVKVNAPFFSDYRLCSLQENEHKTHDIPVNRVYQAYSDLYEERSSAEPKNPS